MMQSSISTNLLCLHVIETDIYLGVWRIMHPQLCEKEERTGNEESEKKCDK